jgi:hypothetical protein
MPNFVELRHCELRRILLLRSSLNSESEMPKRDHSEEAVSSLLNVYILPWLAKSGVGKDWSFSSPPPYVYERGISS